MSLLLLLTACGGDTRVENYGAIAVDHDTADHDSGSDTADTGGSDTVTADTDSGFDTADTDTTDTDTTATGSSDTGDTGGSDTGDTPCGGIESMDPAEVVVASTAEHVEIPVTLTGCATTLTLPPNGQGSVHNDDGSLGCCLYNAWWEGPGSFNEKTVLVLVYEGASVSTDGEMWMSVTDAQGDVLRFTLVLAPS